MNMSVFASFGRQLLMAVGAAAVTKGYISADNMPIIVGGIVAMASSAMSYVTHKTK